MSFQGETIAIILAGTLLGLLILALGIRMCYPMIRGAKMVEVDVDPEKNSIPPLMHPRTRKFWRILPSILVKLGRDVLPGGKMSAHDKLADQEAQRQTPSHTHSEPQAMQDDGAPGVANDNQVHSGRPRPSIGSNFRFPQIQNVPRRPSTVPPEDVYRALAQAESWWFATPSFIESVLVPSIKPRSAAQHRKSASAIGNTAKEARHHHRRCALLPRSLSVASPLVLITPPTPPKSVIKPEPIQCTPGLHPIFGCIPSLEAQGRHRPTPHSTDQLAIAATIAQETMKDGNRF